jgi:hypothetical protein
MINKRETVEVSNGDTEVVVVRSSFFKLPPKKQREALRLIIWWSIKEYIKTIFK